MSDEARTRRYNRLYREYQYNEIKSRIPHKRYIVGCGWPIALFILMIIGLFGCHSKMIGMPDYPYNSPSVTQPASQNVPVTDPHVYLPVISNASVTSGNGVTKKSNDESQSVTPVTASVTPALEPTKATKPKKADCSLSHKWPSGIDQWRSLICKYAKKNGLDPNLVAAVMKAESGGDERAISSSGALGLMQVMPFHYKNGEDGLDPETSIAKGCAILASYLDQMGSTEMGLRAYNAGPGGARNGGGVHYAQIVLSYYYQYK